MTLGPTVGISARDVRRNCFNLPGNCFLGRTYDGCPGPDNHGFMALPVHAQDLPARYSVYYAVESPAAGPGYQRAALVWPVK